MGGLRAILAAAVMVMAAAIACCPAPAWAAPIRVGSKNFTEQYILAQIYAQALERGGYRVERRINLGSTMVAHTALATGQIDLYPEYTGTALAAVVKGDMAMPAAQVYGRVQDFYSQKLGLRLMEPTAINSTYVMVVRASTARQYHLRTLTDLAAASPNLILGGLGEFGDRADGLVGLRRVYGMRFKTFHKFVSKSLIYAALERGDIDVVDASGTDWQLAGGDLTALQDDKQFFPPYFLVPIVRQDALAANPRMAGILNRLGPLLTNARMQAMNGQVERDKQDPADVARAFLDNSGLYGKAGGAQAARRTPFSWTLSHGGQIAQAAFQHLSLALASVAIALLVAAPLGALCAGRPRLYGVALALSTAVFVIPSLALFALLIPVMGLGIKPALTGLSAYGVLLLLRNIVVGLGSVPAEVADAADGLGYDRMRRLFQVELPLALPLIFSGVRVAIVSAIGITTVAAFIDAGGLGTIILSGIDQSDPEKVIVGGVATALLALGCDHALGRIERRLSRWRSA